MTNAVEKFTPPPVAATALTPIDMLNRAVETGATIEVLEKLMALQERWESANARKAYDAAIAAAKAEIPPIKKNAKGHNNKAYADFAQIASVVDPILSKNGLSYRFRTQQDEKLIRVTCVLSHKEGHAEEATLCGPADASGSKNAIQAIGSTLTYLQRYSLIQALGLSATEDDDGAALSSGGAVTPEQVGELQSLIVHVGADVARFLRYFRVERIEDLPSRQFNQAVALLNAKGGK